MRRCTLLLLFFLFLGSLNGQTKTATDSIAVEYRIEKSLPYRDAKAEKLDDYAVKNCQLDIYYPVNSKGFATLVWIHGGGMSGGKKEIPAELMKRGFAIVGIEYRKNPEVSCPVYIEDAAAAVAWVFHNIAKYGGSPDKIYLSGHSAGGYLDLMIGMDKRYLAKYNIDANRIAGLLPLSPQTITHFKIRKERGIPDTQPVIDEFAPLYHVRKDLPPLVLITGDRELEMLGRYEENAYLMRMMKLVGHTRTTLYELDGFGHGPMLKPGLLLLAAQLKVMMAEQ